MQKNWGSLMCGFLEKTIRRETETRVNLKVRICPVGIGPWPQLVIIGQPQYYGKATRIFPKNIIKIPMLPPKNVEFGTLKKHEKEQQFILPGQPFFCTNIIKIWN